MTRIRRETHSLSRAQPRPPARDSSGGPTTPANHGRSTQPPGQQLLPSLPDPATAVDGVAVPTVPPAVAVARAFCALRLDLALALPVRVLSAFATVIHLAPPPSGGRPRAEKTRWRWRRGEEARRARRGRHEAVRGGRSRRGTLRAGRRRGREGQGPTQLVFGA